MLSCLIYTELCFWLVCSLPFSTYESSQTFSVKVQIVNILGFATWGFCCKHSTLLFCFESSHIQYMRKWVSAMFKLNFIDKNKLWPGFGQTAIVNWPCTLTSFLSFKWLLKAYFTIRSGRTKPPCLLSLIIAVIAERYLYICLLSTIKLLRTRTSHFYAHKRWRKIDHNHGNQDDINFNFLRSIQLVLMMKKISAKRRACT